MLEPNSPFFKRGTNIYCCIRSIDFFQSKATLFIAVILILIALPLIFSPAKLKNGS